MVTEHILRFVLIILAIKSLSANAKIKADYSFRLFNESDTFLFDPHIEIFLKENGIHLDEESEVIIHEEDNYINLNCFNCIINILPPDHMGASSYNEYRPGL